MNEEISARAENVLLNISELSPRHRIVIAIDGPAGSGKSSLAEELLRRCEASVVHMDDFFLPFDMRTPERLAEPGGNVHYERFISDILPLIRGGEFDYAAFDCSTGAMGAVRHVSSAPLVVVEGSYSLHPSFGRYYDLSVFLTVSPEEQLDRISRRGGQALLSRFSELWIPMENRYFDRYAIPASADLLL